MSRIRVSTRISASPREVWNAVEDISTHVTWMTDAVAIRFVGGRRSGVGTTFDCDTRVGPFSLVDRMTVTTWRPRREMGIEHVGLVTGTGRFTLRRVRFGRGGGGTRFTWSERLVFPWWMGGPVGAAVAAPVLRRMWRKNLANLKRRVEGG